MMMLTALAKMQQNREVAVDLSELQCPICLSVPHVIVAVLTQGPLAIANSGRNFVKLARLYRHTWILLDMPSYLRLTLLLTGLSLVSRPPGSFSPL